MEPPKCEVCGCDGRVEVDLVYAKNYVRMRVMSYCATHATQVLDEIAHDFASECQVTGPIAHPCAVDIELVVCDARQGSPPCVFLREIEGSRWLSFQTGKFEAWMLDWELRHEPAPSLGTHRAMVSALRALGGDLVKVTINDVSEGELYHAQLHISQGDSPVVVDMRPSDALVLAVICNIPIYVESLVWQKISR